MPVSSDMMGGGWPKATPSITVMLGVGLCWPQVVLWVPLATNGVMLWVLVKAVMTAVMTVGVRNVIRHIT